MSSAASPDSATPDDNVDDFDWDDLAALLDAHGEEQSPEPAGEDGAGKADLDEDDIEGDEDDSDAEEGEEEELDVDDRDQYETLLNGHSVAEVESVASDDGQLSGLDYWVTDWHRVYATENLLWRDHSRGIDRLLALVPDVDLEDEPRLLALRHCVRQGVACGAAAHWLLGEINFGYFEGEHLHAAHEIVGSRQSGGNYWPQALGLIVRNQHLDMELRARAFSELIERIGSDQAFREFVVHFDLDQLVSAAWPEEGGDTWALTRLLASDESLPDEVRIDAAENLTSFPEDWELGGQQVLLEMVRNENVEPLLRARALHWLDDRESSGKVARVALGLSHDDQLPALDRGGYRTANAALAPYRAFLQVELDRYLQQREERLDALVQNRHR